MSSRVERILCGMQIAGEACRVQRVLIPPGQLNRMKTESKVTHLSSENPLASILCFLIISVHTVILPRAIGWLISL
jgi:hypothetical protein